MNRHVYLRVSVLQLSILILMSEFQYDYVKWKYGEKNYVIWIVHIITDDINKSSGEEVESRSDTFNYQLETPLLKEKKIKKQLD